MHLLAADGERIDDGEAAIDLAQSPGDLILLSAADTELAALAAAARAVPGLPSLRLANLMRLAHPLSVDLWLDRTAAAARLVVVRLMGGAGYWPYGADRLRALARAGGPLLAVIPGEDRWDPALEDYSTLPPETCRRLWRYLAEGGPANAAGALRFMAHLAGAAAEPPPPEALPHAGCYRPGAGPVPLEAALAAATGRPLVPLVFYRALLLGGATAPVDALAAALEAEGLAPLPVFVSSLKDRAAEAFLDAAFAAAPPALVLNATAFAAARLGADHAGTVLDRPGRPVLQVVFSGSTEEAWRGSARGLSARDLTMNVSLPEVDGRLLTRAVSFKAEAELDPLTECRIATYRPLPDRVAFVAAQAAAWVRLSGKSVTGRRIALILSNYPARDGRIANGVGLDPPESAVALAAAMRAAGYETGAFPTTSAELMTLILNGSTNAQPQRGAAVSLPLADYRAFLAGLPEALADSVTGRWGPPEADPHVADGAFRLAIHRFGNLAIGIQPARGYELDPKASYHDPALVPPHHYLAFHAWLRLHFRADAAVHVGKHGNLEWLPGKALGLSEECWPEAAWGVTPLLYPFIVNDPGEGAQAKRRASAAIVDHLMPALARAESYGPLAELETLIDEYYQAVGADPRRRDHLRREIASLAARSGLDRDLGIAADPGEEGALRALDAHLCELKELQIRDGLHVLGRSPSGTERVSTLVAIARVPRSGGRPGDASLLRALAADLGLAFDPLDCDLAADWPGPRPEDLATLSPAPWRSAGDTVERLELLAMRLVAAATSASASPPAHPREGGDPVSGGEAGQAPTSAPAPLPSSASLTGSPPSRGRAVEGNASLDDGEAGPPDPDVFQAASPVLRWIAGTLAPALDRSGASEIAAVLAGLDGRFIAPGPSGAPSRGRPEVLPTGRNFYSLDIRAVPTEAAWTLGRAAADAVALRYFQDEGEWPQRIALSAWGTANMRTGGDDIAEVLAFVGARPAWERGTGRVTGFTVIPLADLGRPRIDVTLRVSGMFRDAFPLQIDLLDSAIRAVAALDEPDEANPLAAARRAAEAERRDPRAAATRIFGAKPGAYGAGMQGLIDSGAWEKRADFAEAFLAWGGFAYGAGSEGETAPELLAERLKAVEAVVHNQDNREHDILDSDDYYQFQGGLAATVETLRGRAPRLYHGDHARPEKPVVRSLAEEIARIVRGRAANPKWLAGVMRHGYKGAFEIAATVDYLFAFAATTEAVADHHFDILYDAYLADDRVRGFIADANPPALAEIAQRFREAIDRGLWQPAANSAYDRLSALIAGRPRAAAE